MYIEGKILHLSDGIFIQNRPVVTSKLFINICILYTPEELIQQHSRSPDGCRKDLAVEWRRRSTSWLIQIEVALF